MSPGTVDENVVAQRTRWIREAIAALKELPLSDRQAFLGNKHNVAAAESYLRRSLEALFDVGRHILAKGFGCPTAEYKEIARNLFEKNVIGKDDADLMRKIAGYRNRMVHFYNEISPDELLEICLHHTGEIETLLERMLHWLRTVRGK
ncbi:MAG: DUF86 domain-containing protein [Syntrophales bacterium]|jgi:uncharacterized protein YutE (UPF0331/DUF86 family)|nr:DUF86 domain-containing protein [Syntrophales bacterium]